MALPPLVKFALVTAASVPATFLLAGLMDKMLRAVLRALGAKAAARPRTVPAARTGSTADLGRRLATLPGGVPAG